MFIFEPIAEALQVTIANESGKHVDTVIRPVGPIGLVDELEWKELEMKIEHFAYQVEEPSAVADWYVGHFGFEVKRESDAPVPVRFLADSSGDVMIEIYNNSVVKTPDYAAMDPLILHLAFVCNEMGETIERLTAAGALLLSKDETPAGDTLAMLRDPWGLAIQLCKRAEPMV